MEIKLTKRQKEIKVLNGEDVYSIMQKVLLRENKIEHHKEHFWIIGLTSDNKLLFIELVSLGGLTATIVEPMNVFRVAIVKDAVQAILVHNHPSGRLLPSQEDKDITDRLIQVGRIIDVPVIDHLIISTEEFYSFVDTGLHAELQQSMKWMPPYEIVEKIRAEEQKIRRDAVQVAKIEGKKEGKKEGLQEKALEMARALKQRGIESQIIAETSGLSESEIEKL